MKRNIFYAAALIVCLNGSFTAWAISPAALQEQIAKGEKLTVIDIRPTAIFQQGHIPGAINVPAGLIETKNLPPLGRVVVCADGLGRQSADDAVTALNRKVGIQAEALDGGYSAWEMSRATTTKSGGMESETIHYITFDEVKHSKADDVVLVDLRKGQGAAKDSAGRFANNPPTSKATNALSDLAKAFPNGRVTKSPFELPQGRQAKGSNNGIAPLLVLIDDGDGSANEMARQLKAAGNTRVVVLAGGEEIVSRGGKPGSQRMGASHQGQSIQNNSK
ncbi:MAG: rhodanese-like domain-containing protein [Limisphaerales bacterium]